MIKKDPPLQLPDSLIMLGTNEYPIYLVKGGGEGAIFEGGVGALGPVLERQLAELELPAGYVKQIFVTHAHPDHVMAHQMTVAALQAAADPKQFPTTGQAWCVVKFYYTAWARSEMLRAFKLMHLCGLNTPLRQADFDPSDFGCPDELITTKIDVRPVMGIKWRALFAHRSQMGRNVFFRCFLSVMGRWIFPYESFRCIYSPMSISGIEKDVFSGLHAFNGEPS